MPNEQQTPQKPTVVYSPLRINWRNVVFGAIIGLLIVAIGVFAFSYYTPNATPVPSVEIKKGTPSAKTATQSATPPTKKDETANWKTFTSKNFNYTIKYPANWSRTIDSGEYKPNMPNKGTYESVGLNIDLNASDRAGPGIVIMANSATDWCGGPNPPYCKSTEINLAGKNATESTYLKSKNRVIDINSENIVIFVYVENDEDLVDKVLSTFKFLD